MATSAQAGGRTAAGQHEAFIETRARTLALVSELEEDALTRVVDPLLSPLLWDLGHIANFEQRWLLGSDDQDLDGLYNPFLHPRAERGELPILRQQACFDYMQAVRERALENFERHDPVVLELVIQHEQQHNETMLQLLRQLDDYVPPAELTRRFVPPSRSLQHIRLREAASRAYRPIPRSRGWIPYPAGEYEIGSAADSDRLIYDNELGLHRRQIDPFEIATYPVTNGEWAEWIESTSYRNPAAWSHEGRQWLADQGPSFNGAPAGWFKQDGLWCHAGFGPPRPVELNAPVCHVSWFEADAFARAHDARLPSEFEWEVAASYDPRAGAEGERHAHAWGNRGWSPGAANLDQLAFGTLPSGCTDHGFGPIDINGQVWEWTATEFAAYPGFEPFGYSDYSQPFFDSGYRVLRGGSWATRARTVDNRFRNWDLPQRRQIFSGLRLARDRDTQQGDA